MNEPTNTSVTPPSAMAASLNVRQRLRASGVHLCISATVALMACALIFLVWYPRPYDVAQGVSRLVLVMIAVDVALGPLITAIVFNPAKRSLKFDLAVVAAIQIAALLYGMHAIWGGRPAYLVFAVDRFELVPIQDVEEASLAKADAAFRPRLGPPPTFAARIPEDIETRNSLMFQSAVGGADLAQSPEFFVPLSDAGADMIKQIRPIDELRRVNHLDDGAWQALLADIGREPTAIGYLPMSAKARDGAVIVDRDTAEILQIRMLTPAYGPILPGSSSGSGPSNPTPIKESSEFGSVRNPIVLNA